MPNHQRVEPGQQASTQEQTIRRHGEVEIRRRVAVERVRLEAAAGLHSPLSQNSRPR